MIPTSTTAMTDLLYIAITAGFFALAVGYARFCDHL